MASYLPGEHEDLSSTPRTHTGKNRVEWCMLLIPILRPEDLRDSLAPQPACFVSSRPPREPISEQQLKQATLSKKIKPDPKPKQHGRHLQKALVLPSGSTQTYAHTYVLNCNHIHINIRMHTRFSVTEGCFCYVPCFALHFLQHTNCFNTP